MSLNKNYKLSICIPTYNRDKYLKQLLDSILVQSDPKIIEIVISDNASTDDTDNLVNKYIEENSNIVYYKWPENNGADKNFLKAIEISSGEYCWLMGSDDLLDGGAIAQILLTIDSEDIYLVDRKEVDINLRPMHSTSWLENVGNSCYFDFSKQTEIIRYFRSCKRLGGLFSFISSIIVKRDSWNKYPCDSKFIGSLYSHAFILLNILFGGGTLRHIAKPLVISRNGNDSFITHHWMQRTLIDLNGYHSLGVNLIGDQEVRELFWSVMKNELSGISVIKTLAVSGFGSWGEYKSLALETYKIPARILFLAEILYPFIRTVYIIKNLIKKIK
jgi:abequosyltransferase